MHQKKKIYIYIILSNIVLNERGREERERESLEFTCSASSCRNCAGQISIVICCIIYRFACIVH